MPMQSEARGAVAFQPPASRVDYSRLHTITPPTTVATGPPRKRLPWKGELRLFELDCCTSYVHSVSRSNTVTSPGAPGLSVPRFRPRMFGRAGGEQLHHTAHRDEILMNQLAQRQADGGFKAGNTERAAFEFLHLFAARVGRVVGRDGVDGAVDDALDDRFHVVIAAQRRLHFVIAVVARKLFVGDGEVVRRYFAADAQAFALRERDHRDGAHVERCATWKRAPVSSASSRSRATITSSEAEGMPPSPSRTDCTPSCMSPPALRFRSSQWSITGMSSARATSMARRMTREFMTGRPSSEMATMPASRIDSMAASSSPRLPLVIAPMG